MIKKADIVLGIVLILCGCIASVFIYFSGETGGKGAVAEISVDGKSYGVYDLDQDEFINIHTPGHTNQLQIQKGEIFMVSANCKDKYCVRHKPIRKSNETIICLPNRVVVTIQSDEKGELDAITN
ncbi:MAG: NusG domain II-containing protein [Anaerovorax sp.]